MRMPLTFFSRQGKAEALQVIDQTHLGFSISQATQGSSLISSLPSACYFDTKLEACATCASLIKEGTSPSFITQMNTPQGNLYYYQALLLLFITILLEV